MPKRAKEKPIPAHAVARSERFKRVRDELDLDWDDWSLRSEVSKSYANHIAQCVILDPSAEKVARLARAAKVSVAYLVDGVGPMFATGGPDPNDPFQTRAALVVAARLLPVPYSESIARALLEDKDHKTDPGPEYWSARFNALVHQYAHAS